MVEWLMLLGIGLLAGSLATLAFVPFVHQRAVRLTTRRLVEATPYAVTEIRADKDHLRAQFAMAIRRLEVNVEEMKSKSANQLAEIARKRAEIGELQAELDKSATMILALRTPASTSTDAREIPQTAAPSLASSQPSTEDILRATTGRRRVVCRACERRQPSSGLINGVAPHPTLPF